MTLVILMAANQPSGLSSVIWFSFLPLLAGASGIDRLVRLAPSLRLNSPVELADGMCVLIIKSICTLCQNVCTRVNLWVCSHALCAY